MQIDIQGKALQKAMNEAIALKAERDEYQQAADKMAWDHKVERDTLRQQLAEAQAMIEASMKQELVAWWESGAEQWDGLRDIVQKMIQAAQPVQEPSPGACKVCGNEYLASRTDIYKDKRPFIYCDCCGSMADRKTWYLTRGIGGDK